MNDFTPVMTVTLFDDTTVTGDSFSIILAVVVAIIHLVKQKSLINIELPVCFRG